MRQSLAAVVIAALGLTGCELGGDDSGARTGGRVTWERPPRLMRAAGSEPASIVHGVVRNDSLRRLRLEARRLELRDEAGERVAGSAAFLSGYVQPIEPLNRPQGDVPEDERKRMGKVAELDPGDTTPLGASWRRRSGHPVRLDYGSGSLPLPRR